MAPLITCINSCPHSLCLSQQLPPEAPSNGAVRIAPAVGAQSIAKQDRQISARETKPMVEFYSGHMADAISAYLFDAELFPAQFEHRMLRQQVGEAIGARLVSRQKPLALNLDIPFV